MSIHEYAHRRHFNSIQSCREHGDTWVCFVDSGLEHILHAKSLLQGGSYLLVAGLLRILFDFDRARCLLDAQSPFQELSCFSVLRFASFLVICTLSAKRHEFVHSYQITFMCERHLWQKQQNCHFRRCRPSENGCIPTLYPNLSRRSPTDEESMLDREDCFESGSYDPLDPALRGLSERGADLALVKLCFTDTLALLNKEKPDLLPLSV